MKGNSTLFSEQIVIFYLILSFHFMPFDDLRMQTTFMHDIRN